jgi:hypothetical protein
MRLTFIALALMIGLGISDASAQQSSPLVGKWVGTIEGQHVTTDSSRSLIINSVNRDGTADVLWGITEPLNKVPVRVTGDDVMVTALAGIVQLRRQGDQLVGTFTVTQESGRRSQAGQVYPVTLSRAKP